MVFIVIFLTKWKGVFFTKQFLYCLENTKYLHLYILLADVGFMRKVLSGVVVLEKCSLFHSPSSLLTWQLTKLDHFKIQTLHHKQLIYRCCKSYSA